MVATPVFSLVTIILFIIPLGIVLAVVILRTLITSNSYNIHHERHKGHASSWTFALCLLASLGMMMLGFVGYSSVSPMPVQPRVATKTVEPNIPRVTVTAEAGEVDLPTWITANPSFPEVVLASPYFVTQQTAENQVLEELKRLVFKHLQQTQPHLKFENLNITHDELKKEFVLRQHDLTSPIDLGNGTKTPMFRTYLLSQLSEDKLARLQQQLTTSHMQDRSLMILGSLGMIALYFGLASWFMRRTN